MALFLAAGLCFLISLQMLMTANKLMPMWLFGLGCLLLTISVLDLVLGARRDFEDSAFLKHQEGEQLKLLSEKEHLDALNAIKPGQS